MDYIFLFLCISNNFGFYPGHCYCYIADTLDSVYSSKSVNFFVCFSGQLTWLKSDSKLCLHCRGQLLYLSQAACSPSHIWVVQGSARDVCRVYMQNEGLLFCVSLSEKFPTLTFHLCSISQIFPLLFEPADCGFLLEV